MTQIDMLLARFIDAWHSGGRPSVDDYLAELPDEAAREELVAQIGFFVSYAPSPNFDEGALARLLDEPAVEAAAATFAAQGSAWPELLPRLRQQADLSLRDLAARLLAAAGLSGRGADRAARHLADMESGDLDATHISGKLLVILGRLLRINSIDLARCGTPGASLSAEGALYRRDAHTRDLQIDLELMADALTIPMPAQLDSEVDELFFGKTRE